MPVDNASRSPSVDVVEQSLQARDLLVGRRRVEELRVHLLPHLDLHQVKEHHGGLLQKNIPHISMGERRSIPESNEITGDLAEVRGGRLHLKEDHNKFRNGASLGLQPRLLKLK